MKLFQVKKRVDKGLTLAISGVDGSGKSSMVEEIHNWLGKNFGVKALHLGKPPSTVLTYPLRPMLLIYRTVKRKKRLGDNDSNEHYVESAQQKSGLIWGLRYLALAYERYKLAQKAYILSGKGVIVICDRYPSRTPGKMDSPRIGDCGSRLVKRMKKIERYFYEQMPKANGLIFLNVSVEEAMRRNRNRNKKDKETDADITIRYQENQRLDYCAKNIYFVDANKKYNTVLRNVKLLIWKNIQQI